MLGDDVLAEYLHDLVVLELSFQESCDVLGGGSWVPAGGAEFCLDCYM